MTVSPKRQKRQFKGRKSSLKDRFVRQLRVENLERRELMASDFAPFHNYQMPHDVDGDFRVSPLDALIVINQLNSVGTGSLQGRTPPQGRSGLVDTDGDNALSPLDALMVINSLNTAEGELVPQAAVSYQFFLLNNDGTLGRNLDPNLNDSVSEAIVNKGEKFVVRTLMRDLRGASAKGIYSAYHDLDFTNNDSSTLEKMELQWSDYSKLKITMPLLPNNSGIAILSGSFKLVYGTEETVAIQVAKDSDGFVDVDAFALNIQNAIEQLDYVGAGNVFVKQNLFDPDTGYNFDIRFRNRLARTNIIPPSLKDVNFTVSAGPLPTTTISDLSNPAPSDADATRAALNFQFPGQTPQYTNGPNGFLSDIPNTPGGRRLNLLGGFGDVLPEPSGFPQPRVAKNVVETAFLGARAGTVTLRGAISPIPTGATGNNLGIAFADQSRYLTDGEVAFETAFVRIVERLTATDNAFPAQEDIAASFNVAGDDTEVDGFDFGIVAVTQPTNGAGTVSF
nr:dockerin type I domain-containing protein [Pirellula sp.]